MVLFPHSPVNKGVGVWFLGGVCEGACRARREGVECCALSKAILVEKNRAGLLLRLYVPRRVRIPRLVSVDHGNPSASRTCEAFSP